MKRNIHFKDVVNILRQCDCIDSTPEQFKTAVDVQISRDLRFDNFTGKTRDTRMGIRKEFVNKKDFIPHTTEYDVMWEEFKPWVNNSISRLQRGYGA